MSIRTGYGPRLIKAVYRLIIEAPQRAIVPQGFGIGEPLVWAYEEPAYRHARGRRDKKTRDVSGM